MRVALDQMLPNVHNAGYRAGVFVPERRALASARTKVGQLAAAYRPELSGSVWKMVFPSGATLNLDVLASKDDAYRFAGAEFNEILFLGVKHFDEFVIRYMSCRLRDYCGVTPRMFGTESWW